MQDPVEEFESLKKTIEEIKVKRISDIREKERLEKEFEELKAEIKDIYGVEIQDFENAIESLKSELDDNMRLLSFDKQNAFILFDASIGGSGVVHDLILQENDSVKTSMREILIRRILEKAIEICKRCPECEKSAAHFHTKNGSLLTASEFNKLYGDPVEKNKYLLYRQLSVFAFMAVSSMTNKQPKLPKQ